MHWLPLIIFNFPQFFGTVGPIRDRATSILRRTREEEAVHSNMQPTTATTLPPRENCAVTEQLKMGRARPLSADSRGRTAAGEMNKIEFEHLDAFFASNCPSRSSCSALTGKQ